MHGSGTSIGRVDGSLSSQKGVRVRSRRLVKIVTPLILSAVALSACGGDGEGSNTEGDSDKKTYKIAYQGPLSGDNAQLGINMRNAVELAVDQAQEKGDLPFNLEFVEADDQGTPDGGPPAAQKLIDDGDVIAVVGPAFSGATKASEPLFSQANLVSVSPSATNPDLTSLGFTSFARVVPPDDAQGQEAARFMAKGLKAKKVYSVDDKSEYGTGLSKVIETELKTLGVPFVREGIAPTKDYSAIGSKITGSGADVIYYSGYFADFALFTKAVRAAGFKGKLVSGDGSNDDQFIVGAGGDAEGVLFTCPCADARIDPKAADFAKAYKAKFNVDPGTYSPESYDAANAIISVLSSVGDEPTREAVTKAVLAVDFPGITKQIKFTEKGEVEGKTIFVYEVKGWKRVINGTTEELSK